jgi:MoaA/NifB/PqqE/SkfB family radical SAM enzyme
MKNKTCILAEQGLHLHNSGRCNSCSDSLGYWLDDNGMPMDLTTHSLEQIWNSNSRRQVVEDLRNGIENPGCEKCWQKERVGIKSKREISNKQWQLNDKQTPQYIDLKWGNVCNLKCRHCNPWTSSKWLKEWYAVERDGVQEYSDYLAEFKSTQKSYHPDNKENFHDTFNQWFADSTNIMLYGGEGMYVKDVQRMFSHAVETGNSKNIDVYINTNGTIYSEEWIELLSNFRSVRMAFSIDGVKNSFDYIRTGADWNTVVENFNRYKQLKNMQVDIVTTIFTLNVYDCVDILYSINEDMKMPAVNFVYGPEWWDIRILPPKVKQEIYKENEHKLMIKKSHMSTTSFEMLKEQVDQVQRFLLDSVENSTTKYEAMMNWIRSIDQSRSENFKDVFPEYNNLIKVYNDH